MKVNIVLLYTVLATPGYTPPQANFDGESAEAMIPSSSIAPPKKGKKGCGEITKLYCFVCFIYVGQSFTVCVCVCLESSGRKRKASASKNSSGDKSQLEGAAEAEESQQVKTKYNSCLLVYRHWHKHLVK